MPKKGLPWCKHSDGTACAKYWLIKDGYPRYKIECQRCGKQRWSTAKHIRLSLKWKSGSDKKSCIHCGYEAESGHVCDKCYSQYTPGMLADLEG